MRGLLIFIVAPILIAVTALIEKGNVWISYAVLAYLFICLAVVVAGAVNNLLERMKRESV